MVNGTAGIFRVCTAREATFNRTLADTFANLAEKAKPILKQARQILDTQEREALEALTLPPRPEKNPRLIHQQGTSANLQYVNRVEQQLNSAADAAKAGKNPFTSAGESVRSCLGL